MPNVTRRNADVRKELEHLDVTLETNSPDLPQLDKTRGQIRTVLGVIREASVEMDLYRAQKQDAAKRYQGAVDEGRKLISYTKVVLKQHYGSSSEKLAEFGVQPFRGRTRTAVAQVKPAKPEAQKAAPEAPAVQEPKATDSES
jgi:hypothetical protein